jgi:hypothetical protein
MPRQDGPKASTRDIADLSPAAAQRVPVGGHPTYRPVTGNAPAICDGVLALMVAAFLQ